MKQCNVFANKEGKSIKIKFIFGNEEILKASEMEGM